MRDSEPLYLDFETYGGGVRGERPVLATVLDPRSDSARGSLRTFVLDHRFLLAARQKELGLLSPGAFSRWLTAWQAQGRAIAGFSMHEHAVLHAWQPDASFEYINVLPLARRWRARHHPDAVRRAREAIDAAPPDRRASVRRQHNGLVAFLRLAGIGVPRSYGAGETTQRLRRVEEQLAARGHYSRLTAAAKRDWVQVVRHNRFDVAALRALDRTIVRDQRRAGDDHHPISG